MSKPLQPLEIRLLDCGRRGELLSPFTVEIHNGVVITVPEGFVTDFASVPRFFWRIIPPWGKYARAAVVHDYLYEYGIGDKKTADRAFMYLMTELKVKKWKRILMYFSVKLFGRGAWK